MGNFLLLSSRLKWAVTEKENRDLIKISNSDLARVAKTSRASVTNWMKDTNKIGAVSARLLGDYLSVNALWIETGEGRPEILKAKNYVKNTTIKELVTTDPLQGMANKLSEVFLSLSENNRELLQLLANKMYEHDHPNDVRASGKRVKSKEKESQ
jgi:hypothetical protein